MLTCWTSLVIMGLAKAYRALGTREYLEAAHQAATFLYERMYDKETGKLRRCLYKGEVRQPAGAESAVRREGLVVVEGIASQAFRRMTCQAYSYPRRNPTSNLRADPPSCSTTSRRQVSAVPGLAEDYAFTIRALLDLFECSFQKKHLRWARELQVREKEAASHRTGVLVKVSGNLFGGLEGACSGLGEEGAGRA